ncbi:MAG: VTT domain-containing protein [Clostridia bacterium]|nr:VTT domain-containing protein [Clostridia bacterium]
MNRETKKRIALVTAAVLLLAAGGYAAWRNGILKQIVSQINSVEALRELIGAAGPWAVVVYFLLQMMTVIIAPIPSNVTMMAGALALGFWPAMIVGVSAVIAGSVVVFLAARRLGRKAVMRLVDRGVMEKYLPVIEEKQDMFLFLTLLFPFFPDDALCILAGLTSIPLKRFVIIMALTRPWGLVFAALLGSGAFTMPAWAWAVLTLALAAVFAVMMKYSAQIENRLFEFVKRISRKR